MLNVLKTLFLGASARAEEQLTDHLAIDLIEQKIRESEGALSLAKSTLAALIIRQRNETQTLSRLETQIADLETRARQALVKTSPPMSRLPSPASRTSGPCAAIPSISSPTALPAPRPRWRRPTAASSTCARA